MQDVADRYPAWMDANRAQLSQEEITQYEKQLAHINQICALLEAHGDSKFDELLQLLQEVSPKTQTHTHTHTQFLYEMSHIWRNSSFRGSRCTGCQ